MNKFVKCAILTGAITLGVSSFSFANFIDIDNNSFYSTAINTLVESKVINGYPDNTFKPEGKVTRAEFAKMISIAENLEVNEKNKKEFTDIAEHWAKEFIDLAASNNLLKGYTDNSFKPSKQITYGEVATILLRTLNIYEVANENMNWPDDCMNYAFKIGLFDGVATNDLVGNNSARRDNVALMIYNKINLEDKYNERPGTDISGEKVEDTNNDANKDQENITPSDKNNTDEIYIGTVEEIKKVRGEDYVTIKHFNGNELEIKVNSSAKIPELNTLMIYELTDTGKVKIKKQLSLKDIEKDYLLVEEVDNELIKIKDMTEILDFEKEEFVIKGKTYKLNKLTFYMADMIENDDDIYVFDNVESVEKEDLGLKEEDRLIFDSKTKMMFVIRGIEE